MNKAIVLDSYKELTDSARIEVLRYFEKSGDVSIPEDFLISALAWENNPLAQWFLVMYLGKMRSTGAINLILNICLQNEVDFGHTSLHAICAKALGQIGKPALMPVLDLLSKPTIETRRVAVDALGEIRDPEAIDVLEATLENDNYDVKLWAALSLSKIGRPALPQLVRLTQKSDIVVGLLSLDAIIKIQTEEVIPILERVLEEGSTEQKLLILTSAQWYHSSLRDSIELAKASSDVSVAQSATEILRHLLLGFGN